MRRTSRKGRLLCPRKKVYNVIPPRGRKVAGLSSLLIVVANVRNDVHT